MRWALLVGLVAVVGCGKGKPTEAAAATQPVTQPVIQPASPAKYDLKISARRVGEKRHIVRKSTTEIASEDRTERQSTEDASEDYIEHIVTADNDTITKATRAYRLAKVNENGKLRDAAYAGQTLVIEKDGDLYTFSVNGRKLTLAESGKLPTTFSSSLRPRIAHMVPAAPISAGESWTLGREALRLMGGTGDPGKKTVTGKLEKVFTDSGKTWATVKYHATIVDDSTPEISQGNMDQTVSVPINGTPYEVDSEEHRRATVAQKGPNGKSVSFVVHSIDTTTVRLLK